MRALILRWAGVMISCGGVVVDGYRRQADFPGTSMVSGFLANSMGYDRTQYDELDELQRVLKYAVRCDRPGEIMRDYQSVSLTTPHMLPGGWTTWGEVEERSGSDNSKQLVKETFYRADAVFTLAVSLPDDISVVAKYSLKYPARPLFIGRKCCTPSQRILLGEVEAENPLQALIAYPRIPFRNSWEPRLNGIPAWWLDDGSTQFGDPLRVASLRDWRNQVHTGRQFFRRGLIFPPAAEEDNRCIT
jgi:CRISPR system Cascade subunit CasD